jgi:hypothetical protein
MGRDGLPDIRVIALRDCQRGAGGRGGGAFGKGKRGGLGGAVLDWGGLRTSEDFTFWTSNKQLSLLIRSNTKPLVLDA